MTDEERYERGQEIVRDVEREFAGRPMPEMVEEVRARVEKLVVTDGGSYCAYLMKPVETLPEEPQPVSFPEKAFPDSFYYKPTIVEEPPPVETYENIFVSPQQWITPRENFGARSHADWNHSALRTQHSGLLCMCGHPAEEHGPACFHLIEGCGCEGFLKMPQGSVEGA